jgi:peptide/nickel transport system permease protein
MTPSRKADRSTALLVYLGIFLFIPAWDIYALFTALRAGWRKHRDRPARLATLYPLRRLIFLAAAWGLAWFGASLPGDWIAQPGPFGILVTGLRNLPTPGASQIIAPGVPVGELIGTHLPNSLWLFFFASLYIALFSALLAAITTGLRRIGERRKHLGRLSDLLVWAGSGSLSAPVGAIAILVIHVAAIRMGIIPSDFSMNTPFRIGWLLIPACLIALFPSLVCARAGLAQWESTALDSPTRLTQIAAAMGSAFLDQAGWIAGSLIVVEMIFRIPGLGWLAWQAITLADAPALGGTLKIFLLFMLIMRARAAITAGFRQETHPEETAERQPRPLDWGRAAVVGLFLLILLAAILAPLPADPQQADPSTIYALRSPAHPLGTDQLGRDVLSRILEALRVSWLAALTAGVVAASFGGLWGAVAAWVRKQHPLIGDLLAGLILLPAEAAILLHPVLIVLALNLITGSGETITGLGVIVGLALVPRTVWMIDNGPESMFSTPLSFKRYLRLVACIFMMANVVSLLYSVSISTLGLGVAAPTASVGNLLSHFGELIASEIVIHDGRFIRLIVYLALPGVISAWGGYLLQDFLADQFESKRGNWLSQMLS